METQQYPGTINVITGYSYEHIREIVDIIRSHNYSYYQDKTNLQIKQILFLLLVRRRRVLVIDDLVIADGKAYATNNTTKVVSLPYTE